MKALLITLLLFASGIWICNRLTKPPPSRWKFSTSDSTEGTHRSNVVADADWNAEAFPGTVEVAPTEGLDVGAAPGDSSAFVPPNIEPLEVITQNWTVFPPTAFPRHVKLSKPVSLRLENGTTMVLPAGSHAVAVGAQENVLGISLLETSPAYGHTFVHDTDLPAQVRASYDLWKRGRLEEALLAWKRRQPGDAQPGVIHVARAVNRDGMPLRNRSGGYDLLLAGITSGQVTDIKPDKIRRWGKPVAQMIDGQSTWTVSVFYETMAFCGQVDAEAQAQVRNGKLLRWIYPGSGEPVP